MVTPSSLEQTDPRDAEIERLRGSLDGLLTLLELPSGWVGSAPRDIARSLLDTQFNMLGLNFAYFQWNIGSSDPDIEAARCSPELGLAEEPSTIGSSLSRLLGQDRGAWPTTGTIPCAGGNLAFATVRASAGDITGILVAGSLRPDFPAEQDLVLLRAFGIQAGTALREARHLREPARRLTDGDPLVADDPQDGSLQLDEVLDGIPGFVAILSAGGAVERVNRQILDYCGQSLDELRRWGENGIVHPEDLPDVLRIFVPSIAGGIPYFAEQRLRRHDGHYRWFDNRGVPVRDRHGRIVRWYVLLTDIDDRRRAELAVAESERTFRQTFDAIPTLAWCNRVDGSNEFLNQRWHDYTGLSPEEATGWGWQVALHPDDLPRLLVKWQHMLATGESGEIEARLRRHDGVFRWFLFRCDPLRDASGAVVKWFGTNSDIDDFKVAERALAASERNLQLTIDTIPALAWSAAADGSAHFFNQNYLDFTGLPPSELHGWQWTRLIHPDDVDAIANEWSRCRASGVGGGIEARMRRRDGVYRWFLFRATPFRDEQGNIVQWFGINTDIEDLKRAELALAESELENRQIAHSIAGMVAVFSPDGRLNGGNQPLLDYFRLPLEEIANWATNGITHPDDLDYCIRVFANSVASGEPYDYETRFRRHDGVYRWFQIRGLPLRDGTGRIVRWYGLLIDIDDRKRADAELLQASRHLNEAQRLSRTGSFTSDPVKDVHFWSEEFFRICEIPRDTAISHETFFKLVHPDDLSGYIAAMQQSMQGIDQDFSFRIVTPNGITKYLHVVAHRVEEIVDRPVFIGAVRDITESKNAEEALRRSEAFLADGQRISLTGTFSWRVDTDVLTFSDQMHRIFEVPLDAPLTLELVATRVHPEDRAAFTAKMNQVRGGRDHPEYDLRLLMEDGRIKHLRIFDRVVHHPDGRTECIGVAQDVTARRLAEDSLDKVRSDLAHISRVLSLGALTASIAHEVNQPLSGIITNANTCLRMLGLDPPNVGGAIETARRTIRDGNRAAEVIARLRSLFRRSEFAAERVDLNEAVREIITLSMQDLQRRGVAIQTNLTVGSPVVFGDRVQLQQVILNLVLNAVDALSDIQDRPRQLFIETEEEGESGIRVTVRDNGMGLAEGELDTVFNAFHTTKKNGMGIGLYVSKSIVERHGGRLWASRNPEGGAIFSFAIPRNEAAARRNSSDGPTEGDRSEADPAWL